MTTSNRAAALRWLAEHVGTVLDTVQTAPDGRVRWSPGPRTLEARGATRFVMVAPGLEARPSYMTTDPGNRFYVDAEGLTVEALTGEGEIWHSTRYSVAR